MIKPNEFTYRPTLLAIFIAAVYLVCGAVGSEFSAPPRILTIGDLIHIAIANHPLLFWGGLILISACSIIPKKPEIEVLVINEKKLPATKGIWVLLLVLLWIGLDLLMTPVLFSLNTLNNSNAGFSTVNSGYYFLLTAERLILFAIAILLSPLRWNGWHLERYSMCQALRFACRAFLFLFVIFLLCAQIGFDPAIEILRLHNQLTGTILLTFSLVFLIPVIEEVVFRQIFYSYFRIFFSPWTVAISLSLLFALCHPSSMPLRLAIFSGSLLMCRIYERYRTITAPIIVHVFFNAVVLISLPFFAS